MSSSNIESELYYLVAKYLESGPCHRSAELLKKEIEENSLLPKRFDWLGRQHDNTFDEVNRQNSHISRDHLFKIVQRTNRLLDAVISPSVSGVSTLLGDGRQSLLRDKSNCISIVFIFVLVFNCFHICFDFQFIFSYKYVAFKPSVEFISKWVSNVAIGSLHSQSSLQFRYSLIYKLFSISQYLNFNLIINFNFFIHSTVNSLISRENSGPLTLRQLLPTKCHDRFRKYRRLLGHLSSVYCVSFDRTGRYIFTVSSSLSF
jgi:hypothetical protein